MSSFVETLNLRPQERRLVVIVASVVFLVLNLWLVWPNFGALGKVQQQTKDARVRLKVFSDEISKKPQYEKELRVLENQGVFVGSEEQSLRFQQEVASQAALSGVAVQRYDPSRSQTGRTNSFFEEQTLLITVNTGEKELVDFLYNLGARNSLIRVRSMTLTRDVSQIKLQGSITLVESFQRKPPPKASATAPSPTKTTNQTVNAAVPPRATVADATRALVVKLESSACADPPALIGRLATPSTRTTPKATRENVSFMPLSDLCPKKVVLELTRNYQRRLVAVEVGRKPARHGDLSNSLATLDVTIRPNIGTGPPADPEDVTNEYALLAT